MNKTRYDRLISYQCLQQLNSANFVEDPASCDINLDIDLNASHVTVEFTKRLDIIRRGAPLF